MSEEKAAFRRERLKTLFEEVRSVVGDDDPYDKVAAIQLLAETLLDDCWETPTLVREAMQPWLESR